MKITIMISLLFIEKLSIIYSTKVLVGINRLKERKKKILKLKFHGFIQ